ncbi:UNVERIFIED_CONTAM: Gibberellin receptor GID1B [Sesamum radiatum]|uniref:Gibberellin receptor GID1B n=1 Tax=Sesamum radiatum TaxID=300843 RepID=A0AAW2UP25_SESRA
MQRVVPLNTWILISNFKLAYHMLRRPDGTFNRELNEFLDRKVTANANPVDGVYSFDVIDRATSLLNRVYLTAHENEPQRGIVEVEKPLSATEIVPSGKHIYLAGDSSGGNIAHHVAVRAAEEGVEVLGNILLHPLFGGQERTESERKLDGKYFVGIQDRDWYWRAYLPEGEDRDHPACNVFGPRSRSLEGLKFPKSLVVVAGLDLLQDWQLRYVEGLEKAGQEVKLLYLEKATIGFYFLPNNDHFQSLMDEMRSFIHP